MNNLYAGADGCRGGWVAALLDEQFRFRPLTVYPTLAALVTALSGVQALLVDIPMGLREQGDERACDLETRRLLGSRGSTLFRVPVREAVHQQTHHEANERNRAASGKGIAAQTFGICQKIAEADLLLRANPELQRWVYESHPEACFAVLNGGPPLPEKKRSPEGQKRRLELISRYSPNAAQTLAEARDRFRRSDVADDDILDAMGLALAAHLCRTKGIRYIPAEPEVDPLGLRMAIVVPSLSDKKQGSMQIELLVIRHGQSVADIEERHEGRADFPLTDLGREQARKMAARVAREYPPEAIWASPLKRAAEVAEILGRATGLPVRSHPGLMEWDNGHLAGLTRQEALVKYPPPPGRRPLYVPVPGGESEIQFRARVEAAFHEILAAHPEGRVAIIAHGGTISMLFRAFLRLPLDSDVWLATADTGMHRWRITPERRVVLLANSTAHLER